MIVAGFGGALTPDLSPGDVVVARSVLGPRGEHPCALEPVCSLLGAAGVAVHRAPVASSPRLVTGEGRARLAALGADVVDMESAWLAPLGQERLFAVVRVVVDGPSAELWRVWTTLRGGVRAFRALTAVGRALAGWTPDLAALSSY